MFRKLTSLRPAVAACGTVISLQVFGPKNIARGEVVFADKAKEEPSPPTDHVDNEEEKWAKKAEQCPLCKMALSSPCVNVFKEFDRCLDKLNEKYKGEKYPDEEGMECFSKFHQCMMDNIEFFKKYMEQQEAASKKEEDGEEEKEIKEKNEEVK